MPSHFDLIITADTSAHSAHLRLLDAHGVQLHYQQVDFTQFSMSEQLSLFHLRNYLRNYVEPAQHVAVVAQVGVLIAERLLGETIFRALHAAQSQRTLRIQLPGAEQTDNHLAAALARVPWEIARASASADTLAERNLLVRVVHDMKEPPSQPLDLAPDEPLRVLFVFAEAKGSTPLGLRQERLDLQQLFASQIYGQRRVVADFLSHGVTRERLEEQINSVEGYHILHWSGHGNLNALELARSDGQRDLLTGQELLDLFATAGGFLPRLVFLSACHSGDILRAQDWASFTALAAGHAAGTKDTSPPRDIDLAERPGFTGTAHALLAGGVPSVVAMRYAVGDDYARHLAVHFYRHLLADAKPKSTAAALTQARNALLPQDATSANAFSPCDHATPVLYGAEQPGLTLRPGTSPAKSQRDPRLHRIAELTSAQHPHFVGRTWPLAELGAQFIGTSAAPGSAPVAVITGLGGMGKTALTAEALALWQDRFTWVLLYQAKPNPLSFDGFLLDVHQRLASELGRYHEYVREHPADAIHRPADAAFTGSARLERLTRNLLRAMQDEPLLIVLDNFETQLRPQTDATLTASACQDPAWDHCLATLAQGLGDSHSRVLITSRRPLAALAGLPVHTLPLGPLPSGEAALYLRFHPGLRRLLLSGDKAEESLAQRVLRASRFHPLLMDRLARLADDPALRSQLQAALHSLEQTKNFSQLPELFAVQPGDNRELAYLDDALTGSIDQLIATLGQPARQALWMIALANEPVDLGLLRGAWSGEDSNVEQLRQIKTLLENLPALPQQLQEQLKAIDSPELRAQLAALPPPPEPRPDLKPLLDQLVSVGLATAERADAEDENPDLTCHELVRERALAWMRAHPADQGSFTETQIRLAYAQRLASVFQQLQHQDMTSALEAGSRAIVYCVQAQAWDALGSFAGAVVTSSQDPVLLARLIPHLEVASQAAPEGRLRWRCLSYLADALASSGRPDLSLSFYQQAASQARHAAEAQEASSPQPWADLGTIIGNWAYALLLTGQFDAARQYQFDAADAHKQAGSPAVHVIGHEMEALRIDVMQGQVETAIPEVLSRLARIETWWQQHQSSQPVPEAPDAEFLARAYLSALDIAKDGDYARKDWTAALTRLETTLAVMQALQRPAEDLGSTRFNRATVLIHLQRYAEAQKELEDCLHLFQHKPEWLAKVRGSLADLYDAQGDYPQAITQLRCALALCETLPDPADRALSHNNLANYLERQASPAALAESPLHQIAALLYRLAIGHGQQLKHSFHNYARVFRSAQSSGEPLPVPRVPELLALPAFRPLADFLTQREVDLDDLQAAVDHFLAQAQQAATKS